MNAATSMKTHQTNWYDEIRLALAKEAIPTVSFVTELTDADRLELHALLARCCPALLAELSICLNDGPKPWE